LGFEVRVDLTLPDGSEAQAQLTRAQADELELKEGDIVYARPPTGVPVATSLEGPVGSSRRQDGDGSAPAAVAAPAATFEES
jgi:sulfate transport system ATP-binding protein